MIYHVGNHEVRREWIDSLDKVKDSTCGMELAPETRHKYAKYADAGYEQCHIRFKVSQCTRPPACELWKNPAFLLIRQEPGHMLPIHVDELEPYKTHHDVQEFWQNLIFLEDWKCGQVFGVEDSVIVDWKKGDAICWRGMTEHYLVNASLTHIDLLQVISSNDPTQEILQ